MMKKRNRVAAFLTALILTTLCLCQAAFAAQTAGIDTKKPSSLTLDFKATGKRATINLFRVGEWDGSQGKYVLISDFDSPELSIDCETAADVKKNAESLAAYAEYAQNQLTPTASVAMENGKVTFSNLVNGVYLIYQEPDVKADNVTFDAFLIKLPSPDAEGAGWLYDVTSFPKYENDKTPPSGGGDPPGGGGSNPPGGGTTIPPSPVPTGGLVPIEPQPVPLAPLPKTGDAGASAAFYMSLMLAAGLALLGVTGKKQK